MSSPGQRKGACGHIMANFDVPAAVTKVMGKTLVLKIFNVSSAIYLLQNR